METLKSEAPIRILLVDRDESDIELIRQSLADAGTDWYRLEAVDNVENAVKCLSQTAVDVVLLDLAHQNGSGLDFFQHVHEVAPHLPILILTGMYDTRHATKAVREGAQDFVVKGTIRGVAFKRMLHRAIERQAAITTWEENHLRLQAELQRLAITDELTGLYNRRYLRDRLLEEIFRVERYKTPLSLLMLDLDHFKDINDTYGHAMGDEVLVRLAMLVRTKARAVDISGRYGGEEFCIILTETDIQGAEIFARRLCAAMERERFRTQDGREFRVTCSIGVAAHDAKSIDTSYLFRKSDAALYRAKQLGRNRVCVYDSSAETQESPLRFNA